MNTAIIILNYNNADETINCVKRLTKFVKNAQIIVVDNRSTDNSKGKLEKEFKTTKIILTFGSVNGGFAYGNNLGIQMAIQKGFEYICVLNNDVIINNDFLSPLLRKLSNDSTIGVIGPCIIDDNDFVINTGNKIKMTSISFKHGINEGEKFHNVTDKIFDCDFLTGACLIFRSSIINVVGYLPEQYFLNFEETEWCRKIKMNKYRVVCDAQSVICHTGEKTIGKINGLQVYFLRRNIVLFELRNGNLFEKIIFFIKLMIYAIFQTLYHHDLNAIRAYVDGFTGANRYEFLKNGETNA